MARWATASPRRMLSSVSTEQHPPPRPVRLSALLARQTDRPPSLYRPLFMDRGRTARTGRKPGERSWQGATAAAYWWSEPSLHSGAKRRSHSSVGSKRIICAGWRCSTVHHINTLFLLSPLVLAQSISEPRRHDSFITLFIIPPFSQVDGTFWRRQRVGGRTRLSSN